MKNLLSIDQYLSLKENERPFYADELEEIIKDNGGEPHTEIESVEPHTPSTEPVKEESIESPKIDMKKQKKEALEKIDFCVRTLRIYQNALTNNVAIEQSMFQKIEKVNKILI
jgi:hypothetical protein